MRLAIRNWKPSMRLTPRQAAERMCVSLSLVYQLLQQRKLPAYRVGVRGRGKWLVELVDVDTYMENCKVNDDKPEGETELQYLR